MLDTENKTIKTCGGMDFGIFNEDCRKTLARLPDASVDLVISSPPYNIGKEYETKQALETYLAQQSIILQECHRVLKASGSIFWQVGSFSHNGGLYPLDIKFFPILESFGMLPVNRIIWARQHGLHARNKFSARHESLLWFAKTKEYKFSLDKIRVPQKYQDKKSYNGENKGQLSCNPEGKNPGDIWVFRNVKHNHEEQTIHPCQFPEDLVTRVVLSTTVEGDVVFDPYIGTGTVAVVARDHNRKYVGAELDKSYYDVAMRRLSGLPDSRNCFPNLKTLRDYVERTGEPITKFRFDVQVANVATERSKAKIYSEEYHLQEMFSRLGFEEESFSAKTSGRELPDDSNFVSKPKRQGVPERSLFENTLN